MGSPKGTVLEQAMRFWISYTQQLAMIKCVFLYLDRTYVLQTQNIASLWSMGLNVVKRHLADSDLRSRLSRLIIDEITKERDGKIVDQKPLVTLLSMFVELNLYSQPFIPSFIRATREYYEKESRRLVGLLSPIQQQNTADSDSMDAPQYLVHVKRRLEEERQRVSNYLVPSSKGTLLITTITELLEKQAEKLMTTSFGTMVDRGMLSDLANLYSLLLSANRIDSLKRHWAGYIKKTGMRMVQAPEIDVSLIANLLEFKKKLDSILHGPFQKHPKLTNTQRKAIEEFVNSRRNKPIQLLAKYVDQCMRPNSKVASEDDMDMMFGQIVALFMFMQGKDLFEAHYRRDLAKRLLLNTSASIDAEKLMVQKLRSECGSGYTSRLDGMFRDMDVSEDFFEKFAISHRAEVSKDIAFHANVLTQAFWPTYEPMDLVTPKQVEQAQSNYVGFYKEKHSGRKLQWQHSLGTCVLKVHFDEGTKDLVLSLVQGTVMLLFLEHDMLSYKQIQENTALEGPELRRILQSLSCGKHRVLVKEPRGKTVSEADKFYFNAKFSSPHVRIKISQVLTKEVEVESKEVEENVQVDRMFRVDACLVRLMKAHRKIEHNDLVSELAKQIQFSISTLEAKERIEMLIDRDYIKRDDNDSSVYHYIA
ncbi:Cullin-4A [Coemansia sp. RSA 1813]|nr:Cullin-4A [Coemansia sp. RSA 1813]